MNSDKGDPWWIYTVPFLCYLAGIIGALIAR